MEQPRDIDAETPTQQLQTAIDEWIASQSQPDVAQAHEDSAQSNVEDILQRQYDELAESITQRTNRIEALEERVAAEKQQMALEENVLEALSTRLGLPADSERPTPLRGKALVAVAVGILSSRASSETGPIHYKEWFELVRNAGFRVGGKDPVATFLTTVSSSDRVQGHGNRSGLYSVTPDVEP